MATGPGATPAPTAGVESAFAATTARPPVPGEAARVVMQVPAQFQSPGWSQALGDKLVWMAGRQTQSAELILNPPSLGAVEVRLNVSGGEASAQFFSANPAVREALESALPRLRELMGGVGIALGQASVNDQSQSQRDRAAQSASSGHPLEGGASGRLDLEARPGDVRRLGLLDYFA
ncbi:MAG: flagellar hook-length control protein FliK [Pseudomonadota bacterium]